MVIRLGWTCILIGQATVVRLIICLCINSGKQTDHPSRQVIWIIHLHRRTIQIARLDGWSVCLPVFMHSRIIRRTSVACSISMQVHPRRLIHLEYILGHCKSNSPASQVVKRNRRNILNMIITRYLCFTLGNLSSWNEWLWSEENLNCAHYDSVCHCAGYFASGNTRRTQSNQ